MGKFNYNYQVAYNDMDGSGKATVSALLRYAEESTIKQSESIGFGFQTLIAKHEAWFLLNSLLFIINSPAYNQSGSVTTWSTGINSSRLQAGRETTFFDHNHTLLARRKTRWVYMDTLARRPKPTSEELIKAYNSQPADFHEPFSKFDNHLIKGTAKVLPILRGYIDSNGHVNNTHYWLWAYEAIPLNEIEGMRPLVIETNFKNELVYGEAVTSLCEEVTLPYSPFAGHEELFKDSKSFKHQLLKADGNLAASFYSVWRPL
ncbi:MAG: thioesterase [Spirochaetaceae bacterium]|nr:thioesterase [Spirochaetaceae bacterium]